MVHFRKSSQFELRAFVRRWTIELALLAASVGVFILTEVPFALGCALSGIDSRSPYQSQHCFWQSPPRAPA
jgi:hypothetical protein